MNNKAQKKVEKPEKNTQAKPGDRGKSKTEDVSRSAKKTKEDGGKKLKKSKDKDNTIKRAKSVYNCFCEDQRAKVVKDNPDAKPKDIMKLLGEAWRNVTETEKKKYEDLAAKDKERFEKEKKDAGGEEKKGKKAQSKLILI
jgi:hypothetical protein